MWRAKGVPVGWNDLFKVLAEAGWTDLLVVAGLPYQKVRPWLLKAKPPSDVAGSCAATQVEHVFPYFGKVVGRGPAGR